MHRTVQLAHNPSSSRKCKTYCFRGYRTLLYTKDLHKRGRRSQNRMQRTEFFLLPSKSSSQLRQYFPISLLTSSRTSLSSTLPLPTPQPPPPPTHPSQIPQRPIHIPLFLLALHLPALDLDEEDVIPVLDAAGPRVYRR